MDALQEVVRQVVSELLKRSEQRVIDLIGSKIDGLQQQITGIKKELTEVRNQTERLDQEVRSVKADVTALKAEFEDLSVNHLRLLWERSLYKLRIQNFPEADNDQICAQVIQWLKQATSISDQILEQAIEVIYRVDSSRVRQSKKCREVMIKFLNRGVRDEILRRMPYSNHATPEEKILILRDIPYEICHRHDIYKEFAALLHTRQVKYRWLILEGLSFTFKEKSHTMKSSAELNQFLTDHADDLGKTTEQKRKRGKTKP